MIILESIFNLENAFKNTKTVNTKSELIIVLTPKLVRGDKNEVIPDEIEKSEKVSKTKVTLMKV